MKEIKLTQGKVAIVDDCDFEWLNQWKWQALRTRNQWYAKRSVAPLGDSILMHRELAAKFGLPEVDHIDGIGLHNWRGNLRPCTSSQNKGNIGLKKHNRSGYKGVSWDKRRLYWSASIQVKKQRTWLGYFADPVLAAKAYDRAATVLFGDFAKLNFPISRDEVWNSKASRCQGTARWWGYLDLSSLLVQPLVFC